MKDKGTTNDEQRTTLRAMSMATSEWVRERAVWHCRPCCMPSTRVLRAQSTAAVYHGLFGYRTIGAIICAIVAWQSIASFVWRRRVVVAVVVVASACSSISMPPLAATIPCDRSYLHCGRDPTRALSYRSPFRNNVLDQKSLSALTRWRLVVLSLPYPLCALCVGILSILIYFQIGLCDITIGLCEQIICQSNAESPSPFQMCYGIRFFIKIRARLCCNTMITPVSRRHTRLIVTAAF
mgnify:CR=1 FL=1